MSIKQCPVCGIKWINEIPFWSNTNKATTNANVAAIVCKFAKSGGCINPCGSDSTGATDSWDIRRSEMEKLDYNLKRILE